MKFILRMLVGLLSVVVIVSVVLVPVWLLTISPIWLQQVVMVLTFIFVGGTLLRFMFEIGRDIIG